jgi:hypothetical protein
VRLTGSGFGRAEACPASTFLPAVKEAGGAAAVHGNVVHRYLCLVSEVGAEAALELMNLEHREVCAAIDLEQLPHAQRGAWAAEVSVAWDWATGAGREMARGSGRHEYDIGPTESAGTADLATLVDGRLVVLDVKSGFADLGPPGEALQLLFYAVGLAAAWGATEATVGFVYPDGRQSKTAHLDAFDLAAAAERLRAVVERCRELEARYQADGHVTPRSGEHCRYCPAFLRCPAKATLVRELALQAASSDPTDLAPVLDADSVPQVLERLLAAEEVLARVRRVLEEWAATSPVRLPDGRIFGAVEQSKESFDPDVGGSVLARLFGPEVAAKAVEVTKELTKAAVKRELRGVYEARKAAGQKVTLSGLEREAHEAIREAGGATVSVWKSVRVFKPRAQLKEGETT